ncbi:hypothetical protein M2352_004979 [Azospirillum fermentarium]|uniref:DUF6878 family protein n=1 Tax=Azospirillum fermentarium TaxID=1233114 RepID=UPI002227B483|nr:DUF6878 family protein [Azospirillum fermentarium]MCW2249319.1 hypothetical protein [Azospirillum fermentarium]
MCASNHDETIGGVPAAPPAEAEPALWQARAEAHGRLVAEARILSKDAVLAALAAAGLSIVTVTFDGYGDSGQIEAIHAQAGGAEVPLPEGEAEIATPLWDGSALERRPLPLGEAVEALTYDLLTATHDGWEDGDGAFGVLVLDVAGRAVRLEYNERYTASDYYEHDF